MLPAGVHLDLLIAAIETEAHAQLEILTRDGTAAQTHFQRAADLYRRSWRYAPPRSFGRLVGMLKAAIIAGGGNSEAIYARTAIGPHGDSPSSCYALAIATLLQGDDATARSAAAGMRSGDEAFTRTAAAIEALADVDAPAYEAALRDIVASFETRDTHLTGVAIADTAVMLDVLAARRGMALHLSSPVLPPPPHAAAAG